MQLTKNRHGETFLYLGRAYCLALMSEQSSALRLKAGRFCLKGNTRLR